MALVVLEVVVLWCQCVASGGVRVAGGGTCTTPPSGSTENTVNRSVTRQIHRNEEGLSHQLKTMIKHTQTHTQSSFIQDDNFIAVGEVQANYLVRQ